MCEIFIYQGSHSLWIYDDDDDDDDDEMIQCMIECGEPVLKNEEFSTYGHRSSRTECQEYIDVKIPVLLTYV